MVGMGAPDPRKSATADHGREPPQRLGVATWVEVAAGRPRVLLVPVGSCEQHGPHLPLDTDTRIAVALADRVAAVDEDVVVAPTVAFGSSGEHQDFPGTLSVGTAALRSVLVELGRSAFPDPEAPAAGAHRGLVFVNGHGGNVEAVTAAVQVLRREGRPVASWSPRLPGGDAHAGRTETAILLELCPEVVRPERPTGVTEPIEDLLDRLRTGGVAAVSADGVLGDARGADPAHGRELLADLLADLRAAVRGLRGAP